MGNRITSPSHAWAPTIEYGYCHNGMRHALDVCILCLKSFYQCHSASLWCGINRTLAVSPATLETPSCVLCSAEQPIPANSPCLDQERQYQLFSTCPCLLHKRLAWFTKWVPVQSGLHRETPSWRTKTNKQIHKSQNGSNILTIKVKATEV